LPLNWFRRRTRAVEEQAPATPPAAAPPERPERETFEQPAAEPDADGQSTSTARKRRRGSRGGRGRKKTTAAATPVVAEKPEKPEKPARTDKPQRKPRERTRPQTRTRTAPRRAPLPKARRELLVSVDPGEKRVAVLEDDVVAEVYLERPEQRSIAGNVYLGIVDNVLPGMEAAFVEIGLEKNGFLYVDEIVGPELEGRRGARKIQDLIQRGQTVLVQAVKDPMKTKGARLTTEISLPGRFVVYVPHGDGLGVSRRLEDEERNRLKAILKEIAPKEGGIIVRTAAEGASAEDVARDLDFLRRLWKTIEARAKTATAPSLIYQEAELPLRVTRDLFTESFEKLYVDHDRTYKRIVGYLKKTSPHMVDRVVRYKEKEPLLDAFGAEQEIRSTLSRRVDLPSGGYLIFDYAEAFTVIDVNTGRFVGSRAKKGGAGRLEDTITKNNLEAVKEVVRQLRLRDVGGIIVIDFIDMANPKNRQQVEDALRLELERDRTKTYVVEISPLGLVEMTRQNVTDGPREVMTRRCPTCDGDGIVVSEGTTAVEIERRLRGLVTPGSRAKAFKVELNAKVAALLVGPDASRLHELEEVTKRRFFFVPVEDVHLDHFRVLGQGSVENQEPAAPVAVADEIELKLGEVGLHDPRAGVGKVKGFEVVVADAGRLVGKKVKVRVAAVMEGVAYGVLVQAATSEDGPITAEAEAERPTRARRPARRTEVESIEGPDAAVDDPGAGEDGDGEAEAAEAPAEDDAQPAAARPAQRRTAAERKRAAKTAAADEDEAESDDAGMDEPEGPAAEGAEGEPPAPKKRTRRGTRGGRNRKRKPTVAAAESEGPGGAVEPSEPVADDGDAEPEADAGRDREAAGPVIHVPGRELGDEGEEPSANGVQPAVRRSSARRGSRGGRNRRPRTAAVGAEDAATDAEAAAVAPEPAEAPPPADEASRNGSDSWEYTPMSEWDRD
jgi:ribonuclease G